MTEVLETTDAVIEALGGPEAVSDLIKRAGRTYSRTAVLNWRQTVRGTFPPETFLILNRALKRKKKAALPSLWRQIEPPQARAS